MTKAGANDAQGDDFAVFPSELKKLNIGFVVEDVILLGGCRSSNWLRTGHHLILNLVDHVWP